MKPSKKSFQIGFVSNSLRFVSDESYLGCSEMLDRYRSRNTLKCVTDVTNLKCYLCHIHTLIMTWFVAGILCGRRSIGMLRYLHKYGLRFLMPQLFASPKLLVPGSGTAGEYFQRRVSREPAPRE